MRMPRTSSGLRCMVYFMLSIVQEKYEGKAMGMKKLIIELPEELVEQAALAQIDVQRIVENALRDTLLQQQSQVERSPFRVLTHAEKVARLHELLPPERLEDALRDLEAGRPIGSLYAGHITLTKEALEPLPEDVWGDLLT